MCALFASVDGVVTDPAEAHIPVTDEGLLRGDGVFEVVRLYGGQPFAMDEHLARMASSAANLRLQIDLGAVQADVDALLGAAGEPDAALRMLFTRGGRRLLLLEALQAAARDARARADHLLAHAHHRRHQVALLRGEHACHAPREGAGRRRGAARHAARPRAGGADLLVLLVLDGGRLYTPPLDDHILDSITRAPSTYRRDGAQERRDARRAARAPSEAFLASTNARGAAGARDRRRARSAPRPARSRGGAAARRGHRADPAAPSPADAHPHRHREPAAVRQGCGRLRAAARRHEELLVHTGQHYDDELSTVFFDELEHAARPSASWASAAARTPSRPRGCSPRSEPLLAEERPDAVLVYGDTNSTLAGALAAAQARIPVAHVEAGMRSFDRAMPEELNRVLTDHLSDLLLCPCRRRSTTCAREGVAGAVALVGDVMVDVAHLLQPRARADVAPLREAGVEPRRTSLATAHRAGNVDDPARLGRSSAAARAPEAGRPAAAPAHPGAAGGRGAARRARAARVALTPPLGHLDFTSLLRNARAVLTDSGGVQKEAYLAGVPCVTLRDTTEWVETVDAGWNVLVDLDAGAALAHWSAMPPADRPAALRRRRAGERVVAGSPRWRLTAADPQHGDARTRGVEHAAAVDDRAGAGDVGREARGTPRGRPARRAGDRLAVPWREPERAQLGVVVQRIGGDRGGAAGDERVAQRERAAERRLLHAAAVGDAEDQHALALEAAQRAREQLDGVRGHRLVDLARDARQPRVRSPAR